MVVDYEPPAAIALERHAKSRGKRLPLSVAFKGKRIRAGVQHQITTATDKLLVKYDG